MPQRPSEPLVKMLRDLARKRGLNTAALAQAAGLERARLKHVLAGRDALTVDDFVALTGALEVGPAELAGMGLLPAPEVAAQLASDRADEPEDSDDGTGADAEEAESEPAKLTALGPATLEPDLDESGVMLQSVGRTDRAPAFSIDPYGNHAQQALQLGFALGCDMFVVFDTSLILESGVPRASLERYSKTLPIRLDAAYHRHYAPKYLPQGVQLTLSFDALHTCLFPWAAIQQVTLFPLPPSDDEPESEEVSSDDSGGIRRGHLRLIE